MSKIVIGLDELSVDDLIEFSKNDKTIVELDNRAKEKMVASRHILDRLIEKGETIYGVNTNMGGMVKWLVPEKEAESLQNNLISAVATNVGECFPLHIVRSAILCRLNSLALGNSAISTNVFDTLLSIYNKNVIPYVPMLGSLGTSGDLGPLAAVALVVTGKGKAWYKGELLSGLDALNAASIKPAKLSYKDGLALINGTSFMVSVLAYALHYSKNLFENYIDVSVLTMGCLGAKRKPFSPSVHRLKKHTGQLDVAENIYTQLSSMDGIVEDTELSNKLNKERLENPKEGSDAVEDAYSIRCTPQILGPVKDNLIWIENILNAEINSASDNPLVELKEQEVYHCGHFHGQYIAMAADHLKITLTTLANLSDRRTDRLLDKKKNGLLPAFLADKNAGIRLGLMGSQFMSTSLTAEMRSLTNPTSIQSLPSTGDFQDIVSMGLIAARQALDMTNKCAYILGAEFFLALHAYDMINLKSMPDNISKLYETYRNTYPYNDADRCLTDELEYAAKLLLGS